MKLSKLLSASVLCLFAVVGLASAQDTNALNTQIGRLEARSSTIILKGFGSVGAVPLEAGQLAVRIKESTDLSSSDDLFGLAITVNGSGTLPLMRVLVDDDELNDLTNAVYYLIRINYNVTTLPGFEASYLTRGGLKVIAHAERRDGAIAYYLQFGDGPRVPLSPVQISQFYGLLAQGRKNLDSLKPDK